ncbi:hypothetical protein [Geodermatophilus sp. SYSU D00079]
MEPTEPAPVVLDGLLERAARRRAALRRAQRRQSAARISAMLAAAGPPA